MKTYRDHARATRGITVAADDRAHQRPRRVRQGGPVLRHRHRARPDRPRRAGRRGGDRGSHHRRHGRHRRIVAVVPARGHRPHRGAERAGPGTRHRLPHRRLPRRLRPAVGRAARATRCRASTSACPGVTSMSADTHKYGYAAKGTSVVLYRSARAAPLPVLHHHRLARRPVLLAHLRRQPAGRARAPPAGPRWSRSARPATSTPPGASSRSADAIKAGPAGRLRRAVASSAIPLFVIAFASTDDIARRLPGVRRHDADGAGPSTGSTDRPPCTCA